MNPFEMPKPGEEVNKKDLDQLTAEILKDTGGGLVDNANFRDNLDFNGIIIYREDTSLCAIHRRDGIDYRRDCWDENGRYSSILFLDDIPVEMFFEYESGKLSKFQWRCGEKEFTYMYRYGDHGYSIIRPD